MFEKNMTSIGLMAVWHASGQIVVADCLLACSGCRLATERMRVVLGNLVAMAAPSSLSSIEKSLLPKGGKGGEPSLDDDMAELLNLGLKLDDIERLWKDVRDLDMAAVHAIGARLLGTCADGPECRPPVHLSRQPSLSLSLLAGKQLHEDSVPIVVARLVREFEDPPSQFKDPVSLCLMKEPMVLSSGHIFDRETIYDARGNFRFKCCPLSREPLERRAFPNHPLKAQIVEYALKRLDALLAALEGLGSASSRRPSDVSALDHLDGSAREAGGEADDGGGGGGGGGGDVGGGVGGGVCEEGSPSAASAISSLRASSVCPSAAASALLEAAWDLLEVIDCTRHQRQAAQYYSVRFATAEHEEWPKLLASIPSSLEDGELASVAESRSPGRRLWRMRMRLAATAAAHPDRWLGCMRLAAVLPLSRKSAPPHTVVCPQRGLVHAQYDALADELRCRVGRTRASVDVALADLGRVSDAEIGASDAANGTDDGRDRWDSALSLVRPTLSLCSPMRSRALPTALPTFSLMRACARVGAFLPSIVPCATASAAPCAAFEIAPFRTRACRCARASRASSIRRARARPTPAAAPTAAAARRQRCRRALAAAAATAVSAAVATAVGRAAATAAARVAAHMELHSTRYVRIRHWASRSPRRLRGTAATP